MDLRRFSLELNGAAKEKLRPFEHIHDSNEAQEQAESSWEVEKKFSLTLKLHIAQYDPM